METIGVAPIQGAGAVRQISQTFKTMARFARMEMKAKRRNRATAGTR
jgi:hypothetical protein